MFRKLQKLPAWGDKSFFTLMMAFQFLTKTGMPQKGLKRKRGVRGEKRKNFLKIFSFVSPFSSYHLFWQTQTPLPSKAGINS